MTNMRIVGNLRKMTKEYQIVENYNQVNSQSISTAHVVYDFEYLLSHFRGKRRKDIECPECGKETVHGAEEALLMGYIALGRVH